MLKRDRNGTSLKLSSFAAPAVASTSSVKDYKFEWVFYEVGLELKGEDKYSAYVKHIGTLLESIKLVDPLTSMHAVDKSGGAKPLGSKSVISTNMTVFFGICAGGAQCEGFSIKKLSTKGREGRARMSPTLSTLAFI